MKAQLRNYRQSPRKVRLVADLVRGKRADESLSILEFTPKRSSRTIRKLIESALRNAEFNEGKKRDDLYIKEIMVDEGFTLRRFRPRARGRAGRLNKRTSHISVVLGEEERVKETRS